MGDLATFDGLAAVLLLGSNPVLLSERFTAFLRILLQSSSTKKIEVMAVQSVSMSGTAPPHPQHHVSRDFNLVVHLGCGHKHEHVIEA